MAQGQSVGATLKHLIGKRPVELDTVLSLGIEIADALDAANNCYIPERLLERWGISVEPHFTR